MKILSQPAQQNRLHGARQGATHNLCGTFLRPRPQQEAGPEDMDRFEHPLPI